VIVGLFDMADIEGRRGGSEDCAEQGLVLAVNTPGRYLLANDIVQDDFTSPQDV